MYTPINPCFTISKWGVRGNTLYGHVSMMCIWGTAPSRKHLRTKNTTNFHPTYGKKRGKSGVGIKTMKSGNLSIKSYIEAIN